MTVTQFEIRLRRPLAGGAPFGDVGPYEELKGTLHFAIDPKHAANERIADVALAPRDHAGRVEFESDVSILLPVDRARASGRVMLDVVNRGNTVAVPNFNRATRPAFRPGSDPDPPVDPGDGFLMRRGYVVISCGWQIDLPEVPGLLGLRGPEALDGAGNRLKGRVYTQLQTPAPAAHLLLSDRGHRPYTAADLDERDAILTVRDQPDGDATTIARQRWSFARVDDGGTVVPDARYIRLDGGFEKGRLYQVTYTAVGAPLVGLGIAALRDSVAWLKHGTAREGNPAPGLARYAYAYGRSQTGRLLRTLVYHDLNVDEQGREALDGIIANVAGGLRGEFNQRFGQNSKDRPHMMDQVHSSTDGEITRRVAARGSKLRVFYTNSSAEYHRGDASLAHTDPDGARDIPSGPSSRIYHFAGTEHGLGVWPPTERRIAAADPAEPLEHSQNLRNTIDYAPLLRGCLVNLDRWVTAGVEPPPSRHPRLADRSAVPFEALHAMFDKIPGAHYPRHHARPCRLDFSTLPPRPGPACGSLVSAVDADGNETGGIALPEVAVALGTHTGWTLRHPEIGGEAQRLVFAGATIPFPRTRAERDASGDPRLSIAERYRSRDDYLERVRRAALALASERYILDEDIDLTVALAARAWDYWTA
jgi:alpha/beta hydrolase family protein